MKINFRKIAAVGAGLLMTGMSFGIAAAANYPAPFVAGGSADVAVVYGAGAAASDVTAAGSIQSNLATSLGGGSTSVTGGESYKFELTSTKFHLGDNFSTIKSIVDDDELETLLTDGQYTDDDNDDFDYTQKIEMNNSVLSMFEDNDYVEDEPTVGFKLSAGYNVLNYTLSFIDQPRIGDLPTTDLPLMGKSYYVLSNTTSGANLVLTLLDSAEDTSLSEGESATVSGHSVSIAFIDSDEVKLTVDGQTTNSLNEAETQKLSDGSYVGIKDILFNSKDTGISSVEFSVGSGKLKLTSGSEIQINDETVNGIKAVITNSSGTATDVGGTLSSIELEWNTEDDSFITPTTSMTMPGFGIVKLSFGGLKYPTEEEIKIEQGSDTYIMLNDFPVKYGEVDIPLLYGVASGTDGNWTGIGKDVNNKLATNNATDASLPLKVDKDSMFVVTYESATECYSYVFKPTGFTTNTASNNITTLQVYKDGAWTDEREVKENDTFEMGSASLGVQYVERSPNYFVNVTANSSSTKFNVLCSAQGLKLWLPWEIWNGTNTTLAPHNTSYGGINFNASTAGNNNYAASGHGNDVWWLSMAEEDKDSNIADGDKFNISLGWDSSTTAEPEVVDLLGEEVTAVEIQDTDVFRSFMYSALATEFLWNKPSSSQDSMNVIYHGDEVTADVYITSPDASVTSEGGALGTVVVKDTEVASFASKNLVVVGGSCINSAAASLLGGAYCESDFTDKTGIGAGQFLIKHYSSGIAGNSFALLVAGYEAADTVNAATYLTTHTVDTSTASLKGTSATSASTYTVPA